MTQYKIGDKVLTVHDNKFVEGIIVEGPNFCGQFRVSMPDDKIGWYKSPKSQLRLLAEAGTPRT